MTSDELTQLRQELEKVKNELEKEQSLSRFKSEHLAQMSHEIRTHLNGMIGMIRIALNSKPPPRLRADFWVIQESAHALMTLVNSILDISKVESGKMLLEDIEFEIEDILLEVQKILTFSAKEKGIFLTVEKIKNIPYRLKGDPVKIQQILMNLTTNAIKFTKKGGVTLRLKLTHHHATPHDSEDAVNNRVALKIEVQDTGIGIPASIQPNLFEAFTQADASITRKYGGSGLGLTICKKIVELMQGEIGFQSIEDQGTTFWFQLSLEKGSNKLKSKKSKTSVHVGRHKEIILVVEDNLINQKVAVKMLEKLGFRCHSAENGKEALEILQKKSFDLILMDCQMPELNGYLTTQEIRENEHLPSRIPIIAMTANATQADQEKCRAMGMNGYLTKPFSETTLLEAIQPWLHPKAIDEVILNRLHHVEKIDRTDLLHEFIRSFLENAPLHFQKIQTGLQTKDADLIFHQLHSLKTSCSYLGALTMKATCQKMEEFTKDNQFKKIQSLYPELENAFTLAEKELLHILNKKA